MSIIRQLARGHCPRLRATRCAACSEPVYAVEPFCPCCGDRNRGFDPAVFDRVAKSTVAEAQQLCARGWSHQFESVAWQTDPHLRRRHGKPIHCAICGRRLKSRAQE